MEDIIVDEPAPSSLRNRTQKKVRKIKPKRDFSVYLFDWLVKAVMIALLISINFMLFASAGNFEIFSSGFTMASEPLLILTGIFAISVLLMFLLSFSTFIQNVVVALVMGGFVYISLNQFALFDKFSFIAYLVSPYLGNDAALNFMGNSDKVITVLTVIISFIFLALSDKKNIAYFTGILLVIFGGVLVDEYLNRSKHSEFRVIYDNSFSKAENGKKFIYIMLPNAGSYSYLDDMKDANSDKEKVEKSMDIMLGFFAKNGFNFYPNAFVVDDDPFTNMIKSFNNLSEESAQKFIASNVSMDGYWSFKNLNDENIYLNKNQLYDVFKKANYKLSAYKSRGIDMCGRNGIEDVDRCVEKFNRPVSFKGMNISSWEKTELLLVQWFESMGIFNDLSSSYTILKAVTRPDNMPMIGVKYDGLYVVDSPKTLEIAAKDIVKDKGNHAYFILMDMPSDMFVYNEFCRIKPAAQWLNMESLPWIINKNLVSKRSAYLDQMICMYGKLEQFMDYLKKARVLDKSVIVIQGLNGVNDLKNVTERQFIPDFKNKKLVTMAIRDPLKKTFKIAPEICRAPDILNQYLFKKGNCIEMHGLGLHMGAKKEIKGMLGKLEITSSQVEKAMRYFVKWFKSWEKVNKQPKGAMPIIPLPAPEAKPEDDLDALDAAREPDSIEPEQVQDKLVGEAPSVAVSVPENPEDDVETLQEKMIRSDSNDVGDGSNISAPFGNRIPTADDEHIPDENQAY